jgi:hypothetical protein
MPNFANGKIYSIRSHQTEQIYVGSTTQPLSVRFGGHKRSKPCSSSQILQYPDAYIELIEEFACENKMQLNRREGELIRTMNCVNRNIAGRTDAEYRNERKEHISEQSKQYHVDNKEHRNEQSKQYRQNNKEHLNEQMKQYYQDNKEHLNEQMKQYRIDNIQTIKAKQHQKHNCCCGGRYTNAGKSGHFKTTHHIEFVNQFHNRLRTLLHA